MARTQQPRQTKHSTLGRTLEFHYRKRRIQILLDKVLFLRFLRGLHGRFWGIVGISVMIAGFGLCFALRPQMFAASTAFSDFGNDLRTAPYFMASVFFAAYGMWRWQHYLARTWKRGMPVTGLIWLTVIGLYIIALMPVSVRPVPYYIHMFGVILAGTSMLATVIIDWLLTKPRASRSTNNWRFVRLTSLALIISGGWITFGSADVVGLYRLALVGESLLLAGYLLWIALKTYMGEGNRTALAKILHRIVLIE